MDLLILHILFLLLLMKLPTVCIRERICVSCILTFENLTSFHLNVLCVNMAHGLVKYVKIISGGEGRAAERINRQSSHPVF